VQTEVQDLEVEFWEVLEALAGCGPHLKREPMRKGEPEGVSMPPPGDVVAGRSRLEPSPACERTRRGTVVVRRARVRCWVAPRAGARALGRDLSMASCIFLKR